MGYFSKVVVRNFAITYESAVRTRPRPLSIESSRFFEQLPDEPSILAIKCLDRNSCRLSHPIRYIRTLIESWYPSKLAPRSQSSSQPILFEPGYGKHRTCPDVAWKS